MWDVSKKLVARAIAMMIEAFVKSSLSFCFVSCFALRQEFIVHIVTLNSFPLRYWPPGACGLPLTHTHPLNFCVNFMPNTTEFVNKSFPSDADAIHRVSVRV